MASQFLKQHFSHTVTTCVLLALVCMACASAWAEQPSIQPRLTKPGELLFTDDFDGDTIQPQWNPLHGTRWSIDGDALKGIPATEEFQKSRTKHSGGTPSMKLVVPARDCILQISFKLTGKMVGAHFGFNDGTVKDGTGHVCRVTFDIRNGTELIKDKGSKVPDDVDEVLATSDWTPKRDQWYTLLLETRGDQVIAQVESGPTLTGRNDRLNVGKSWVNLPTRGGGEIHYDNVRIWRAVE